MMKSNRSRELTRREFLGLAGLGVAALGGCGVLPGAGRGSLPSAPGAAGTGRIRTYSLEASTLDFHLDGRIVRTWGYNGIAPGPEIRVAEGDTLRIRVKNELPADTTIHWHGLPVPNAMDGVPDVTQPPIRPGDDFTYEFVVPTVGTYLYHSHAGLQLDRGLYGPLIVEPRRGSLAYDREHVLLLDDWLDGLSGRNPEAALAGLQRSGGMGGMSSGTMDYPRYLVNGRTADDPETLIVRRGEQVRMRLINAAAETVFRFSVAGHSLTVTHADGQSVEPVEIDTLRIGMGERYDVLFQTDNPGVWQIAAAPENKSGIARALLRYGESRGTSPPPPGHYPSELGGKLLSYADLLVAGRESFPSEGLLGGLDRSHHVTLSGGMGDYVWAIDGQRYPDADTLIVREGEWVQVTLRNMSMMAHPMHLHGHFFQVRNGTGRGPFKDTVLVEPHMGELTFDFVADNPGNWFFHCHNAYHMESEMARVVSYGR